MARVRVVSRLSLKSRRRVRGAMLCIALALLPVALLMSACGSQRPTVPATKVNDFMHRVIGNPAPKRIYSAFAETDSHLRALEYLRSRGRAWFEAARAME